MATNIRVAQASDVTGILAIYAPFCEASTVSFEAVAPTADQMQERIRQILVDYPWLVCEIDGELAGYVYACRHRERAAYRWAVDVAVYIAAKHHRRGVGRALYSALFSILREQGYYKAFAGVTLPNPASVGLHERVGFRSAGKFQGVGYKCGRWLDVGWWQLELQPEQPDPPNTRPFSEICRDPAVAAALTASQQLLHANSVNA